jgi:hypothetical protein
MRVVFLIERKNYYRVLGPVIERALARGWTTECWHDYGQPRRGSKASEFPDATPVFRHGRPQVRTYRSKDELGTMLAAQPPDAVIALQRPAGLPTGGATVWMGLQYTLDVAQLLDGAGRTAFDALGLHTEYWARCVPDAIRLTNDNRARGTARAPEPVDRAAVLATVAARGRIVGFPEMDQAHSIDPADVRRRLGLPTTQPVVLYIPFPFKSNPSTFWVRNVYGAGAVRRRLAVALTRRSEYRAHVERGYSDRGVVDAVRAFCDANAAALVVKARAKDPVPRYLALRADRVLYDQQYYPATILELLRIATLCVHFFSTVAYESAYTGVPSICVSPASEDLGFPPIWREWFLSADPGSSWNYPGVVYSRGLDHILRRLPSERLGDYPLEPAARTQYVEKFVGFDDAKCSDRVLDAVEGLVEERRR